VLGLSSGLGPAVNRQLQAMVFGLVLFTLLIQGTTMNWLVKKVGIIQRREERDEYDLRRARVSTTRAAYDHIRHLYDAGMVSSHVWDIISNTIDPYTKELTDSMQDVLKEHPEVESEELDSAWRELLQYQRLTLTELLAERGITEDIYNDLTSRIDSQLASSQISWDSVEDMDKALWEVRAHQSDPEPDSDQ
jgi:CPA1 family monovalent cation:H+ antiporter